MTQEELAKAIQEMDAADLALMRAKNTDYAGIDDAFHNLRMCEKYGVPAEKGILVRMSDKMTRISNLLTRPALVTTEKLDETLKDLGNYSKLLRLLLRDRIQLSDAQKSADGDTGGDTGALIPATQYTGEDPNAD